MSASEIFRSFFDQRIEEYQKNGINIVATNFGQLSIEQVNDISFDVENKMRDSGVKKGVIKRVFSILVEALQNVRIHGEHDENGSQNTYMVVGQNDEGFHIATANIIFDKNIEKVESRMLYINSLNEEELKEHYMQVLTNGEISQKGGAGLGFITIGMKSKNKLKYKFKSINNDKSLFELESFVTIENKE